MRGNSSPLTVTSGLSEFVQSTYIYQSNCSQPNYPLIAKYCNIWRNAHDIGDAWESMESIVEIYGADKTNFSVVAGPGNFNDPDMVKFHQSASEITTRVDLFSRKYLVYKN